MPSLASVARYADAGGLSLVAARMVEKAVFEGPLSLTPLERAYWAAAPRYYRALSTETDRYPRDVEPFALAWVDPAHISRFTKRPYPFWVGIKHRFGTVRDGTWDRRDEPPIEPTYDGTPPELYLADRFEDTVLHRSLRDRFCHGIPWDETEFVTTATRIVSNGGTVWNGCQNEADIEATCAGLDQLYDSMRTQGCLSYRQLLRRRDALSVDFLKCLENEIVVDIGRDGSLLFVDGRHRLSIAKLLGLDRVPIAVLVRHEEWMQSQNPGIGRQIPGHPDLTDR